MLLIIFVYKIGLPNICYVKISDKVVKKGFWILCIRTGKMKLKKMYFPIAIELKVNGYPTNRVNIFLNGFIVVYG